MLKPNPQIAEFVCGVKAAAECVEAAICNLDAVLASAAVSNRLWAVVANMSTILELANMDVQSAVEDFLHEAETLPASTKLAA